MDKLDDKTLLKRILDSLPFEVFVKDRDSRYIYVNKYILENDHLSLEDIIGKKDTDLYPLEFSQMFLATDKEVLTAGKFLKFTEKNVDGSMLYIQKKPFTDENGETIGVLGFSPEVSAEYKENIELKREVSKYKGIFDKATLGIAIYDTPTCTAKSFNNAFAKMLGRSPEELLTFPWEAYSHPDEVQENHDYMDKLVKGAITGFQMEKRYIKSDGSIVWVHMVITKYEDEENKNTHLVMVSDITERKKAEEEVLYMASHDRLTGVYNRMSIEEKLFALDRKGEYPLSVIIMDINGLKLINDALGHREGDNVIKRLTSATIKVMGSATHIGRMGGDEFMVILEGADREKAKGIVKSIKKEVEQSDGRLTSISIGYATKTKSSQLISDVIQIADGEMYQDKLANANTTMRDLTEKIREYLNKILPEEATYKDNMERLAEKVLDEYGYGKKDREDFLYAVRYSDIGKVRVAMGFSFEEASHCSYTLTAQSEYFETGYYILRHVPGFEDTADMVRDQYNIFTDKDPDTYSEQAKVLGILRSFADKTSLQNISWEEALKTIEDDLGKYKKNMEVFLKVKDIIKRLHGKHN